MKLNVDLGYILKRLIVIGLGFLLISQLKSCDVFALEYVDVTNAVSNCRGIYYNNNTISYSIGTPTYRTGNSDNYFYCQYSGSSLPLTHDYKFQFFGLRKASYSSNPDFQVGKKYNITFNVRTSFYYFSGSSTIGPNNLIEFRFSPSISGENAYGLFNGLNTAKCSIDQLQDTIQNNLVLYHNYKVTCKEYEFTNTTIGYQNLYLYLVLDTANNSTYPMIDLVDVSNIFSYEEIVTNVDINKSINDVNSSINDSDVSQAEQSANSIFNTNNPDIVNYGLESVITAPIQILARATDSCSPLSFSIFHKTITLPCGDALFWTKDFSSYNTIFSNGETDLNTTRNTFRAFWNLFFGGAIIFHLLTILYEVLNKAIDPTNDDLYFISDAIDSSSKSSSPVVRDSDGDEPRHVKGSSYNPKHSKQSRLIHSKEQSDAVVLGSLK